MPLLQRGEPFTVAAELLGHPGELDALALHPTHAGQRQGPPAPRFSNATIPNPAHCGNQTESR